MMTIEGVTVVSRHPCLTEGDVRAALERAVRTHVSTVTVDRDGQLRFTDPLTAAHASVRDDIVGTWTFAPEPWEHVEQDEIEWATGVLTAAWANAQNRTDHGDADRVR